MSYSEITRKTVIVLDAIQARALLEAAKNDRLYALYVIAFATGMRQGELFGLKWSDVALKAGTISVQRTVVEEETLTDFGKPKVRLATGEPKTKKWAPSDQPSCDRDCRIA